MIIACPIPPATHIVSSPNLPSSESRLLSRVVMIRAPVIPNGWPSAIAPPLTVELVRIDADLVAARQHLGGKRLVHLD